MATKTKKFRIRIILKSGRVLKLTVTKFEMDARAVSWTTPDGRLYPHLAYLRPEEIAAVIRRPYWRP